MNKPLWPGLLAAVLLAACQGPAAPAGDEHAHAHEQPGEHARAEAADHTRIPAEVAREQGIRVATVGPGTIAISHQVQGLLTPVEGRTAQAGARFAGIIKALDVGVGERVEAGQRVALIESNRSLGNYAVRAPITGIITARHTAIGGVVDSGAVLYEVADLGSLWADLHIFGRDAHRIEVGMPVTITRLADGQSAHSRIGRILPGIASASQSTIARASLDNADGKWRPGAAIRATITMASKQAALVVPLSALQQTGGVDYLYQRQGDVYTARAVTVGARDARNAEILAGIAPGAEVVVAQSYLIKADIEKAGASHAH